MSESDLTRKLKLIESLREVLMGEDKLKSELAEMVVAAVVRGCK